MDFDIVLFIIYAKADTEIGYSFIFIFLFIKVCLRFKPEEMASLNSNDEKTSLIQDSDELVEMYCEHCEKDENKYVPAEGFCVECVEYMCAMCIKFHKRYVKDHSIQDKDSMPQDFCLDKCSIHTNQLIKFYCNGCQKIACSDCKSVDHKNCTNVNHLPAMVEGIEKSKELSDLIENMDSLSEQPGEIENQINSKIQSLSLQETQAVSTITKHKEELFPAYKKHQQENLDSFDTKMVETIARLKKERQDLVEKLAVEVKTLEEKFNDEETEIMRKVQNVTIADKKVLNSLRDRNLRIKTDIEALSFDMKKQQNIGQRCNIFITMKHTQKNIEKFKLDALKVNEEIEIHFHVCSVKPKLKSWYRNNLEDNIFSFQKLPSSNRKRIVSYYSDIEVKLVEWSGLCCLSDTTLLVADFGGKCLFVFYNMKRSSKSNTQVKLSSGPWDITKVEDNKVAVTFPNERIVRLITFSETMTVTNTDVIKVGADCCGIACSNNNLIVSYDRPAKVQILDMSGHVLKTFVKDSKGKPLFSNPLYLAVSPDNTTIYVSDWDRDTVTSLTFDGKVKAIYKDDQLSEPCQLTVDESGTVYVCWAESNNVHQLSSDLTKVKILLNESHGINIPLSVAYCQNNNRLYVGMFNNKNIKVFNLSLE
ncbi:uncharacterized protein LOC123538096 [Mercenaria mercenaria]|uniref:uncharacterized protein LOC123538096 n=1 Tax=Mercenaria mercenaria TaxID=6596 RepID=UPI00234E3BDD|nr:uncharacterized protein LOC123538096 [Mercenaria mercenaria]